ncbi:phytoene/squalene synthase family protein [Poriferisphaera sp. WC338]|uniref:phytoene/squalene synthase family protein n=1 Tax=Poriferisphaera sp. WC338 TaxID=3425129 RepID=UPI003D814683
MPQSDAHNLPHQMISLTPAIQSSFEHCLDISKTRAKNFYYGMKLTPEPKRAALYAIYAFMRACDDLADEPLDGVDLTPEIRTQRINTFRAQMQCIIDNPTAALPDNVSGRDSRSNSTPPGGIGSAWAAFNYVMQSYPINPQDLHHMLDGQIADMTTHRYQSFPELYQYCYNVASTVGLTCIAIWGYKNPPDAIHTDSDTRKLAEYRGIALQLTNILRDLKEDAERDRIYLPAEELAQFNFTPESFIDITTNNKPNANFDALMQFQIKRAYDYYRKASPLELRLTPDCRGTCWAMMRIYRGLLDQIAKNPRRVLTDRVRLSTFAKLMIGLSAKLKRNY